MTSFRLLSFCTSHFPIHLSTPGLQHPLRYSSPLQPHYYHHHHHHHSYLPYLPSILVISAHSFPPKTDLSSSLSETHTNAIPVPIEHQNVPDGHRSLHDTLYANVETEHEPEQRARSGSQHTFIHDGSTLFPVDDLVKRLIGQKIAAVYEVYDDQKVCRLVDISRNVLVNINAHRKKVCNPDHVSFIKLVTFDFPSRSKMEQLKQAWISKHAHIPVGNSKQHAANEWILSYQEAAEVGASSTDKLKYEDKKYKLRKAMADTSLIDELESTDLDHGERVRRTNLEKALKDDNWSHLIDAQNRQVQLSHHSTRQQPNQHNDLDDSHNDDYTMKISPFQVSPAVVDFTPQKDTRFSIRDLNIDQVDQVLNEVRPMLVADGGNISVLDVSDNGDVKLMLEGACGICPSSSTTMKLGIEKVLRRYFPNIQEITAVSANNLLRTELSVPLIDKALDEIRPILKGFGGKIQVVSVAAKRICLKYSGPPNFTYGIELMLRDKVPDLLEVTFEP